MSIELLLLFVVYYFCIPSLLGKQESLYYKGFSLRSELGDIVMSVRMLAHQ